jgi:hypothetical protein
MKIRVLASAIIVGSILILNGLAIGPSLAADSVISSSSFATDSVQGNVSYRAAYSDPTKTVAVSLNVFTPSALRCLDYVDFEFDLRKADGTTIKANDTRLIHGAAQNPYGPPPPYYPPTPHRVQCWHGAIKNTDYVFNLNSLYGDLKPGVYHLQITLAPEDHSIPKTPLPSVTFKVKK